MKWSVFLLVAITVGMCSAKLVRKTPIRHPKDTSIKYYNKQNDITIPIMIHLDKAFMLMLSKNETYLKPYITRGKKHNRLKIVKLLVKDILKDVETIFLRPNLKQKIKFHLIDVKIIKSNNRKIVTSENASEYLKNYCVWQGEKKRSEKKWWYSVLITGLDLFYLNKQGAEVRKTMARSYKNGVCSNRHSCTIVEWRPSKNLAFMLTHEMAHSLGVRHDGPPNNDCKPQGFIMDANYNTQKSTKKWSSCNQKALSQFLKSEQGWCLRSVQTDFSL